MNRRDPLAIRMCTFLYNDMIIIWCVLSSSYTVTCLWEGTNHYMSENQVACTKWWWWWWSNIFRSAFLYILCYSYSCNNSVSAVWCMNRLSGALFANGIHLWEIFFWQYEAAISVHCMYVSKECHTCKQLLSGILLLSMLQLWLHETVVYYT